MYYTRFAFILVLALLVNGTVSGQQLPDKFTDEIILDDWFQGIGLTFDEAGRGYLFQKSGLISFMDIDDQIDPTPILDLTEEIGSWGDHGLMSLVLDPAFLLNGHIYLYYQVDRHHLLYHGTPTYHPDSTATYQATIGRITRYTLDISDYKTVVPNSRKVILGETISTGIPLLHYSHGTGTLLFGTDGSLFASAGDGSSFAGFDLGGDSVGANASQAIADGIITPDQDIGSYRAQYVNSLNGKIIRIDPDTGDGLPTNPFYNAAEPRAAASRVWALGFRNPFRFTMIPGTGDHDPDKGEPGVLVVGDVGSGKFEEIDLVTHGGQNFGWPIYEGNYWQWGFYVRDRIQNKQFRNPLFGIDGCDIEYFEFHHLLADPSNDASWCIPNPCDPDKCIPAEAMPFQHTYAEVSWNNMIWTPGTRTESAFLDANDEMQFVSVLDPESRIESDTFTGICTIGGAFNQSDAFPEEYEGAYFQADFSDWIKVFHFDENNKITKIEPFNEETARVIHLVFHPINGCLYYVNYREQLRKICYGGHVPPTAIAKADTVYGGSQLEVQFDGSESKHVQNTPFTYLWDFKDGTTSDEESPKHTFTTTNSEPTSFEVNLTLTDTVGDQASDQVIISLNNTPPNVSITSIGEGARYPLDKTSFVELRADVSDKEHANEDLTYVWRAYLHHNTHYHEEQPKFDPESYAVVAPVGCDGEFYYFRVQLTVTDPEGLSSFDEKLLYPNCEGTFMEWVELTGKINDYDIDLMWSTAWEDSLSHFEVQRSKENIHFYPIGEVDADASYTFKDASPILGTNFYRIKIFDENNGFDYSPFIKLNFLGPASGSIDLYPNPANDHVNLVFGDDLAQVNIELFDAAGKRVIQETWSNIVKNDVTPIMVSELANGVYFYRIDTGTSTFEGKVAIGR